MTSHSQRSYPFPILLTSLLLIAPFGYGIPFVIHAWFGLTAGTLFLVLCFAPSVLGTLLLAQRFGRTSANISLPFMGCGAPLMGFVLILIALIVGDTLCEQWSFACGGSQLWSLIGLAWIGTILACAWIDTSTRQPSANL